MSVDIDRERDEKAREEVEASEERGNERVEHGEIKRKETAQEGTGGTRQG